MEIEWMGTATVRFIEEGASILFDPFIPMNPQLRITSLEKLAAAEAILITHGHFDHLADVPGVMAAGSARVYCSETAAASLVREGVDPARITTVAAGGRLQIGTFAIRVLKGRHVRFDSRLVRATLLNRRVLLYFGNFIKILAAMRSYPEGQTLMYEIKLKSQTILHMGSLNMDETERYPERVDIMTIPFQGRSDIDEYAAGFVRRVMPRMLYLHHFDDSFPPISSTVETSNFIEKIAELFPGITTIVPTHGEVLNMDAFPNTRSVQRDGACEGKPASA